MKNLLKYAFVVLFGAVVTTSCTNEYEYDPAPADVLGGNGYINADKTQFMFTPSEEQTFTFIVGRIKTDQAGTLSLKSDNPNVKVPETVDFAANDTLKTVTATCNVAVGSTEAVTISLADEDAFLYQQNAATFTIQVFPELPVQYIYGLFNTQYPNGFARSVYDLGNGSYRLPAYGYDYDIDFTIMANNEVYVKPQPAWVHSNYGDVYIMGNSKNDGSFDGTGSYLAGTYDRENGLIEFSLLHYVPGLGSFTAYSARKDILVFTGEKP